MWETIIFLILGLVIGLLSGKPLWQKSLLTAKEAGELAVKFYEYTRKESEKGEELSDKEKEDLKKEFLDIVSIWKK